MATITLRSDAVTRQKGVVVLPVKEYQRLLVASVPTYYLKGKAARDLDMLVEEGLREHRMGLTTRASSLSEALAIHKKQKVRT